MVNEGLNVGDLRLQGQISDLPLGSAYPAAIKGHEQASPGQIFEEGALVGVRPFTLHACRPARNAH